MPNFQLASSQCQVARHVWDTETPNIDVGAFIANAEDACTSDELKVVLVRALRAAGLRFLQLSNYRRQQSSGTKWLDFSNAAAVNVVSDNWPVPLALDSRAMVARGPIIWPRVADDNAGEDDFSGDAEWFKALHRLKIFSGITVAIHGPNDVCNVFHFGLGPDSLPASIVGELRQISAMAFIASQRLNCLERDLESVRTRRFDAKLSARELDVIRWCKDGKSYPEIAQILGISAKTVEYHISNAMRKLGVNQKISAIVVAAREGLIEL